MYYFRFQIPQGIVYSPGWHGTLPHCPQPVAVLLYNDVEGYGIARTEDKFVPPEVKVITAAEAKRILAAAEDVDGVWFGDKLVHRWDVLPEPEIEAPPDGEPVDGPGAAVAVMETVRAVAFCSQCHKQVFLETRLPQGMKVAKLFLSGKCPDGHTVKTQVKNG